MKKDGKMKQWFKKHKKEIGLTTGGVAIGVSAAVVGRRFFNKTCLDDAIKTKVIASKDDNYVGLDFHRNMKIGKGSGAYYNCVWNPEEARTVANSMLEFVEEVTNTVAKTE
jgi:hypothetical protein